MIQSDALSQRPNLCPEEDNDNQDVVVLSDKLFVNLVDLELKKKILSSEDYDTEATDAIKLLIEDGPTNLQKELGEWTVQEIDGRNLLFFQGHNYVPKDRELRREILQQYHDAPTAGHPGEIETYNSITKDYWWPGMCIFVNNYVKGCAHCQKFKINRQPAKPPLNPVDKPKSTRPFSQTSMDFIVDLPPIDGYDSIMSVVDHGLSKGVILIPCNKKITSDQSAQLLLDNLYKRFGLPDKLISDRGPQFAAKMFQELCKLLGIKSALSTAYHQPCKLYKAIAYR